MSVRVDMCCILHVPKTRTVRTRAAEHVTLRWRGAHRWLGHYSDALCDAFEAYAAPARRHLLAAARDGRRAALRLGGGVEEKAFEQRGLQPCPGWMSEKSLSPERASGKIPLSPESSMATLMVTHSKSTTRFCRVTQCGYPRGSVAV